MARWSDAMKLSDYLEYAVYLQDPGVYEIGYLQRGTFYAKYIGKAPVTLYQRICTYGRDGGRSSHNRFIRELVEVNHHRLWFHVMKVRSPEGPALREALLMNRLGIGEGGLYEWNCRYEYAPLVEAGYLLKR
jgi:hypothetical protein